MSSKTDTQTGNFTNFSDWDKIERPRVANLHDFGNNYLSMLAISGDDYLRFQAKLNPAKPFQGVSDQERGINQQ